MGNLLVLLQFGLLMLLAAAAGPSLTRGALPAPTWMLAGLSLALAIWTLAHNRIGNFNIRPVPKRGGRLVTSGPYRWIRHPMYTSVLLGAAALAWAAPAWAWLGWFGLWLVLWAKATLEESQMMELHPDYHAYRQRSRRFLPWLL